MQKLSKRKLFKIIWFSAAGIFVIWNWMTFQSWNLPEDTFGNDSKVTVTETDDQYIFHSNNADTTIEVIFFQGGLADPKAYAPLCRKIAESGYTCHLVKMSWRLPQYDYEKIETLFDLTTGKYVIGGHSQGAKMAAQFVYENPNLMRGLFLMGTSHPRDIDLSGQNIPCLKLYAEYDGLASQEEVIENKNKLPKNTNLIFLEGGNHSQFGYLGNLLLDDDATIKVEQQQRLMLEAVIPFLNGLKEGQ